ncbi:hypothetical protein Gotur_014252 [Gossypium turneri]
MGAILASKIVLHNNVSSPFAAKAYAGLQAITSENVYAHKLAQEALEKGEDLHLMRVVSDHNRSAPEGRWLRNPD